MNRGERQPTAGIVEVDGGGDCPYSASIWEPFCISSRVWFYRVIATKARVEIGQSHEPRLQSKLTKTKVCLIYRTSLSNLSSAIYFVVTIGTGKSS